MLTPANADELCAAVREHPRVLAVGARTKPRLSAVGGNVELISTHALSGIVEYDPGEFTFTALAGTPLRDIAAALTERGQYLPFDPPLVDAGATLGGTIAAGLSGAGRFRFGGLRDFILAVRFVDGRGELLRGGAKVVKNAAGFDVPKFLTGSLGRFGVLVEATFKVFPRPASWLTLRIPCADAREAVQRLAAGASARWELDALDYAPHERALYARLAGPAESNTALAADIARQWPDTSPTDDACWRAAREFAWAHDGGLLAKIPFTLGKLPPFIAAVEKVADARTHISAGGDVAFVSLPSPAQAPELDAALRSLALRALVLRGEGAPLRLGSDTEPEIAAAVRAVFDPVSRFEE